MRCVNLQGTTGEVEGVRVYGNCRISVNLMLNELLS